jgi:shikimate kinase
VTASEQSVALIGFMGAGKSHIGMLAAHRLRVPFVDTDALIAEQLGPIEQLFVEHGEAYFRAVERDVAVTVLEKSLRIAGVVSLGGGAVQAADVREALRRLTHIVWLTAPVELLFERAREGGRPLARDAAAFRALYAAREPLYRSLATATVANDGSRSAEAVAADVVALVEAA